MKNLNNPVTENQKYMSYILKKLSGIPASLNDLPDHPTSIIGKYLDEIANRLN